MVYVEKIMENVHMVNAVEKMENVELQRNIVQFVIVVK